MLFAKHAGYSLAVACSTPWLTRSAGYVGASDGRLDLEQHHRLTWHYDSAENGNVVLAARNRSGSLSRAGF